MCVCVNVEGDRVHRIVFVMIALFFVLPCGFNPQCTYSMCTVHTDTLSRSARHNGPHLHDLEAPANWSPPASHPHTDRPEAASAAPRLHGTAAGGLAVRAVQTFHVGEHLPPPTQCVSDDNGGSGEYGGGSLREPPRHVMTMMRMMRMTRRRVNGGE